MTGVQPLRAVTVSLLHWFSGASYQMAFCLKLLLDLFIERIGCTAIFVQNISAALVLRCCGLLKLGDWKNRRKSTTIDRGSFLHKL